jgi:spermidine synthase
LHFYDGNSRFIEKGATMFLLNLITFLSAFLLFQIELIVAKLLLPNYGGSYLVWGACIVFFQAVLLIGYIFAHSSIQRLGIKRYRLFHLFLMATPLFFFPGRPLSIHYANPQMTLAVDVFWKLFITIGPVFFVLSTISLVTQAWLSGSDLPQKKNPYALYAVSNLGSFGGLVTYPFLFEAYLTLTEQLFMWRIAYGVLLAVSLMAYFQIKAKDSTDKQTNLKITLPTEHAAQWLVLGAAGSMLFLSVNTMNTYEIAPMPLLWVIPLGVYLLTFVLNFKRNPWCPRWVVTRIDVVFGLASVFYFLLIYNAFPVSLELIFQIVLLFLLCMYCQNRLIQLKPADQHLTFFYVMISLGGFLGSFFVNWIVPLFSTGLIEYFFALFFIAIAMMKDTSKRPIVRGDVRLIGYYMVLLFFWPVHFQKYNFWGIALILWITIIAFKQLQKSAYGIISAIIVILVLQPFLEPIWKGYTEFTIKRNYYGIYEIVDKKDRRGLIHGTTLHGAQFLDKRFAAEPLIYFGRNSPVGEILTSTAFDFQSIGVIGLGTGTMATYKKGGQKFDFYELDPDMYDIAKNYFTFLDNAAGKVNVIFGDARLSLKANSSARYDVFIVDAFSGDAIPAHLLTKEMVQQYREHLTDKGIVVFHTSNRYVRLGPILASLAEHLGAKAFYKIYNITKKYEAPSDWVVMTWDEEKARIFSDELKWEKLKDPSGKNMRFWTDDYSNNLPLLKTGIFAETLKDYKLFAW